jgi:RND family efflux transporter MFP subunit
MMRPEAARRDAPPPPQGGCVRTDRIDTTPRSSGSRAVFALLASGLAVACGEPAPAPPAVPQPVKIFSIGAGGGGETLEFPGEVSASQSAEPAFEVAGKIIEFPVDEAQELALGDVIARLDARDYEAEVDKARANMNKAGTDLKRYRTLYEKGVSPLTDLESAQRRYEVAEAELRTAEKALEDAVLRAPFDGIVAKKLVADFQNVQAKQPIVIFQDDSTLEVVVNASESAFVAMRPGLTIEERNQQAKIEIAISSIPDRLIAGRIKEFSTASDPVTRTFSATFAFLPPADLNIRPGMTARVIVTRADSGDSATAGSVSIPARAVVSDGSGESFVWIVDPQTMKVTRTPVETGDLTGDRIAIRRGLASGMQVAISGVRQLADGMEVRRFEP